MKTKSQALTSPRLAHRALAGIVLASLLAAPAFAQSKRDTAEYYLAFGKEHIGKDIRLDVAMVKPVHWASPDQEVTFFHALTLDTRDRKFGGGILIMLPESEKEALIKKYGMNHEGFRTKTLTGVLHLLPNRERRGAGVYVVDYKGLLGDKIKDRISKMGVVDDVEGAGGPPMENMPPQNQADPSADPASSSGPDDGTTVGMTTSVDGSSDQGVSQNPGSGNGTLSPGPQRPGKRPFQPGEGGPRKRHPMFQQ